MYEITADYRPGNQNKPTYYVLARSKKEAKDKFERRISWLKVYDCEEVDAKIAKAITASPFEHIIIG